MKTGKLLLIKKTCYTSYFVTFLLSYFLYYSVFTVIFARAHSERIVTASLN